MGWDFTQGASKGDIIRHLNDQDTHKHWGDKFKILDSSCQGNILWQLVAHLEEGKIEVFIACNLLGYEKGVGWGYKDMDEAMHPYYYNCPIRFLDQAPVKSESWRDGVRAYHQKIETIKQLKIGDVVRLAPDCKPPELTIISLRPFLGMYEGRRYRIPKRLIA